uniref:F-actin-capping protein subunit beta n=1 Tax=Macrostomum lignano TaxID=282301 RepID=A0A1I8JMZ0_9PLAT
MEQYQDLYFGGGISSAYLWDMDNGFAGVVLIKKIGDAARTRGQWDSIHVVEVAHKIGGRSAKYKLTATTMLWVRTADTAAGEFDIGGSLTRQVEKEATETETSMRQQMIQVYFDGLNGIVETMRTSVPKNTREAQRRVQEELS